VICASDMVARILVGRYGEKFGSAACVGDMVA
jgi:hypothetical protein